MTNDLNTEKNNIFAFEGRLADILLADYTTGGNILWATDAYSGLGLSYGYGKPVSSHLISGENAGVIKPRVEKSKAERRSRIRCKAEVFTPSWLCNCQNNLVDCAFLGVAGAFNKECGRGWKTSSKKVLFSAADGKDWKDYVCDIRLEIACGEAPYLVSRYDAVTGEAIAVGDRIGLLDRKLRVISENADDENEWFGWAQEAYKSVYGYEWLGDSLLFARQNLLQTFIDFYENKFHRFPAEERLIKIAEIISINIWQMDGLNFTVPCPGEKIYCKIKNWRTGNTVYFNPALNAEGEGVRFNAIVGNPPYQVMDGGAQASAMPVYQSFVDFAKSVKPEYISMLTPARWYAGGKGLNAFREAMLSDRRISVLTDYSESADCFPSLGARSVKGGICYFLWDSNYNGKCLIKTMRGGECVAASTRFLKEEGCEIFVRDAAGASVLKKVKSLGNGNFSQIVSPRKPFGFATDFKGFSDEKTDGDCTIYALKRTGYIGLDEIKRNADWVNKYKLFVPEAIGNADVTTDEVKPILGEEGTLCTETYLVIGPFETREEALNCKSYIGTKFFHFLLSLKKISQHTTQKCYSFIPLQDFAQSWNDEKLFKKYNFSAEEIEYINRTVWANKRGK